MRATAWLPAAGRARLPSPYRLITVFTFYGNKHRIIGQYSLLNHIQHAQDLIKVFSYDQRAHLSMSTLLSGHTTRDNDVIFYFIFSSDLGIVYRRISIAFSFIHPPLKLETLLLTLFFKIKSKLVPPSTAYVQITP